MLANGITLSVKKTSTGTYEIIPNLKEVPDLGPDPERVDNTPLSAKVKQYEKGIGDPGNLQYKFVHSNKSATDTTPMLMELASGDTVYTWKETYPDGTEFEFTGSCSLKYGGGGVNGAVEDTLTIYMNSDLDVTNPTYSA